MTRSLKGRIGFSQSSVDERERGGWPHKSEAAERGTGPLVSSNLKPVVCIRSVIAVVGARLTHDGGGAWPCCVYRGHPSRPRALRSVGRRLRAPRGPRRPIPASASGAVHRARATGGPPRPRAVRRHRVRVRAAAPDRAGRRVWLAPRRAGARRLPSAGQVRAGRGRFKEHGNDGYTLTTRLRLSTI